MEKKLTIAHLASYLPYGLKVFHNDWKCQLTMDATGAHNYTFSIEDTVKYARPILRPLSQITQEIEHNGERFVPYKKLGWESGDMLISCVKSKTKKDLPYRDAVKLFEWGFDVFGLLESGLAIEKGAEG